MSDYAFFPGCALDSSAREYKQSINLVAKLLEINLQEVPDWNCCGGLSAQVVSSTLGFTLNARNLTNASKLGLDTLVACSMCYQQLLTTRQILLEDQNIRDKVTTAMGEPPLLSSNVKSVLEVFASENTLYKLQRVGQKSLSGLKIVTHYGCQLACTGTVSLFENPVRQDSMDKLVRAMGGEPLPWAFKAECCGANLSMVDQPIADTLIERILKMAKDCKAECIVTSCPKCHLNFDLGQKRLAQQDGVKYNIPVLYFSQLMGLVLGANEQKLGLNHHLIDPIPILQKIGLI